jgi:hypothetical protein
MYYYRLQNKLGFKNKTKKHKCGMFTDENCCGLFKMLVLRLPRGNVDNRYKRWSLYQISLRRAKLGLSSKRNYCIS